MKNYLSCLLLFLGYIISAQSTDYEFEVTKTYDKEGNLIHYDSIRKEKNNWVESHYNNSFNTKNIDSLLDGIKFIEIDNAITINDSLFDHLKDVLWFDSFEIRTESDDDIIEIISEDDFSQFFIHYGDKKNKTLYKKKHSVND